MTHLLFLLSVLNAALVPLAAWGEEAAPLSSPSGKTVQDCLRPTERGQRFTVGSAHVSL